MATSSCFVSYFLLNFLMSFCRSFWWSFFLADSAADICPMPPFVNKMVLQFGAIILWQSVVRGWLTRRHFKNIETVNVVFVEKSEDQTTSKPGSMVWVEIPYSTVFELQRRVLKIEAALQERKEQNADSRNNLKQYKERWLRYDESMKSMEKMWQEQLISIRVTRADAAKKKVDTRRSLAQSPKLLQDKSPLNTIDSTTHPINHQNGELDDNDNGNYFQVKLGSHVSKKDVIEEFQKLESQYGAWKKEYSMKEKRHKRWWRKPLTKLRKLSCL